MPTLRPCLRRSLLCAAALTAGGFVPSPGAASPTPPPAAAIQATYDQINSAFARRDLTQCMSFFTGDYTDCDEKGVTINREQARQRYRDHLSHIRSMQSRYTIQNVTPTRTGTMVEMRMHTDGTGVKRVLFANIKGTFTNDLWVRDLWVSTPQGWRLKHRQTLRDDTQTHAG